jgi:hypothetical protein
LPPVPFDGRRILLPILLPVPWVEGTPFPRTVAAAFTVFGIGGEFAPVIVSAPFSLALRFAADGLTGLELRGLELFLTVAAIPFTHITGVVSP